MYEWAATSMSPQLPPPNVFLLEERRVSPEVAGWLWPSLQSFHRDHVAAMKDACFELLGAILPGATPHQAFHADARQVLADASLVASLL